MVLSSRSLENYAAQAVGFPRRSPASRIGVPSTISLLKERPGLIRVQEKFSIFRFSLLAAAQYAALLLAFRFLLPGVWAKQFAGGWPALVLSFLAVHLFLCFFEWWFHRYILHSASVRIFDRFSRGHRHHHDLTPIRLQPLAEDSKPLSAHGTRHFSVRA